MARFHYRNPKSSRHFPASASERTARAVPAPPSSFAARRRPLRQRPQEQPTRFHSDGLGIVSPQTTDRWRELLAPDGTPPALPHQVDYVRAAVLQETGMRPSLRGLTLGQAERILAALNVDPRPLWRGGRDSWAVNVLAICGKWFAVALLFIVILSFGRADGMPLVLLILLGFGLSAARRQRRQAFENRHYRRPRPEMPTGPEASDGGARPGVPSSPQPGMASEDKGNPYDVETYLKRLGGDGR